MNKKLFLLLIVSVGIVVAAAAYTLRAQTQPPVVRLVVSSTSPANQASQNPFLPLVVTFNRAPKEKEVVVSIVPSTKTTTTIEGYTIKITPETTFLPETQYTVSLNTSPQYTFGFTTQTDVGNSPSTNAIFNKVNQQYQRQNATRDAELSYIRLHSPLKENGFTVNYSYANDTYTIALFPPYDQNKGAFLNWLEQSGVTAVAGLRIDYVNQ